MKDIESIWDETHSIKQCAKECNISWQKAVKSLVSNGHMLNDTHKKIIELYSSEKSASEIAQILRINVRTVKAYLPRIRPEYNVNQSKNAINIANWRKKRRNDVE